MENAKVIVTEIFDIIKFVVTEIMAIIDMIKPEEEKKDTEVTE